MRKIAIIIVGIIVLIISTSILSAMTVRIDQPKVRITMPTGSEKSGIITVENPSDVAATVRVYVEDWLFNSTIEGSKDFYPANSTPLSCARWITFGPAEFVIAPFGKQSVSYKVSVPNDAVGGHYAVLFFETSLGEVEDEQGVSVNVMGRLGALFAIEAEGTIEREAKLSDLEVKGNVQSSDAADALTITLKLENTGNVDIATEGTFYAMDAQGLIVARGEFTQSYTLPGDTVMLSSSVSKVSASQIPAGQYDLIITIDLGGIPEVIEAKLNVSPSGDVTYSSL